MNNKITWLLAAAALFSLISCGQQAEDTNIETDPTPVVANVIGMPIHESDIDREIRSMPESLQHIGSDPVARAQILNVMIRRAILSRQAEKIGLTNDPMVQNQIIRARNNILIEELENWQISQIPQPTEQEVTAYYKKHLDEFTIPEQIHARHILVGSEKLAWEILKKLKKKKDTFEALAATHSLDDSNKSRGGDLNWFPRGIMVKEFEEAAFSIKEDGISTPVKTQFGWHIIEVLGKKDAHTKSVEESKEEIASILQQKSLDQWMAELTRKADVKILKPEYRLVEEPKAKGEN